MRAVLTYFVLVLLLASLAGGVVPSASADSITVVDNLGRSVTIDPYPPQRIVSLAPSNTELLFAVGAGPQVVGVDTYSDYPPEAVGLPTVGGFGSISIEAVIGLEPDLILATAGVQLPYVEELSDLGYAVIALDPKSIDDVIQNAILVGTATGNVEGGNRVAQEMMDQVSRVEDIVAAEADYTPRVYFELWHDPFMSFGPDTWVDEIITKAGGSNIFHDALSQYPVVSSETIIDRNPEFIILQSHSAGGVSPNDVKSRPGWDIIDAVRNERIYVVDEDLFLRPGPRIVNGLYTLASILHPEIVIQTQRPTLVTMNLDLPVVPLPFAMKLPIVEAGASLETVGSVEPAVNGSIIFVAYSGRGPEYDIILRDIRVENGNYSFNWQLPSERLWLTLKVYIIFVPDDPAYATSVSEPVDLIVLPPIFMWWQR
ncbi:cobalamin-binding protein [Candidatus Hecatella orcuttiae]|jgi:iron complex transport system substrate-binding protein|uniref:ABC transporter substrate-binding protein n=1 Tax=Candidatus Hecatella orcuttiae TaxID=1935119 RepID=UPI00286827D6|nr:cobalamin-binding protein [Candidatus Hecatella orcuttiae]